MNNFNFLLKLDTHNISGVKKIIKIPDIEVNKYQQEGTLYSVKYYVYNSLSKRPLIIRFTSKDRTFDELYSMDFCDKTGTPVYGLVFNSNLDREKFLKFLLAFMKSSKAKDTVIKESDSSQLTESMSPEVATVLLQSFIMMLPVVVLLLANLIFFIHKLIKWRRERLANTELENSLNRELFSKQEKDDPAFFIYNHMVRNIEHVINGEGRALLLCGPPGMSKTYIVRRTLYFNNKRPLKDYVIVKGSSLGLAETYSLFYENRKRIVILDDFDTPLNDPDMINMLKSITDSYSRRILSLPREKVISRNPDGEPESYAPSKFEFEGKLIIITNLRREQIDRALLSRAPFLEVNYNVEQIMESLKTLMKHMNYNIPLEYKKEVYDFICKLREDDKNIELDFRTFQSCIESRYGNPYGWEEMVKGLVNYKGTKY